MRDFAECQAFVEHLRTEHKHVHEAVAKVRHDLHQTDSPSEPARVREDLQRLRRTLVDHFAEEDQGGCLEEAVSHAPQLSTEVAKIEHEHATILKLIDRLIARCGDCVTEDFRESFRTFANVLQAHEAAENRILHTAFGTGEFESNGSPSLHGESS